MLEVRNIRDAWGAAYIACSLNANSRISYTRALTRAGKLSRENMKDPSAIAEISSLICHTMEQIVSSYNGVIRELELSAPSVNWKQPRRSINSPHKFSALVRRVERTTKRIHASISKIVHPLAQGSIPSYRRTMALECRCKNPDRLTAGIVLMFTMPFAYLYLRNGVNAQHSEEMIMDSLITVINEPNVSIDEIARNIRGRIDLMDTVHDYRQESGLQLRVPYYRMKDTQEFIEAREKVLSGVPYSWIQTALDGI